MHHYRIGNNQNKKACLLTCTCVYLVKLICPYGCKKNLTVENKLPVIKIKFMGIKYFTSQNLEHSRQSRRSIVHCCTINRKFLHDTKTTMFCEGQSRCQLNRHTDTYDMGNKRCPRLVYIFAKFKMKILMKLHKTR